MIPHFSERPVVLVTGADLAPAAVALLNGYELVFAGIQPIEDDIVALCERYRPQAIIVRYGRVTARMMDAASGRLRVISKHGSGIDVIDQKAAAARGIAVRAAVGSNAAAVAEHAWALILACAKSVPQLDARMRTGHWDKGSHKSIELAGRTLGLVGLGAIGKRAAAIGVSLGMRVLAHDPYVTEMPATVSAIDLPALFAQSDVVSLHCPLTDETRGMINRPALAQFKQGAILVNTARGGLIEEDAVIEALNRGKLRMVGLDSFAAEPMPASHPFHQLRNVILSPHVGGLSDTAYVMMGLGAVHNVIAVLEQTSSLRI